LGFKNITIDVPVDFTDALLKKLIQQKLNVSELTYQIERKSLDARNKKNIHWELAVGVFSPEISGDVSAVKSLVIPRIGNSKKVIVIGSGPAGFFAAYTLQLAGFKTIILERGSDVNQRDAKIKSFESTGIFVPESNYAFGEGGAGTFSDGKLTSRSKHINLEREFIIQAYIAAGAPGEIAYMVHPHLGSDNLKEIVFNLRKKYIELGGKVFFDAKVDQISVKKNLIKSVATATADFEADYFIFAIGHSAYDTYRLLMKNGVQFRPKNFALGFRAEHPQQLINQSQWGVKKLPGVKAAEYRFTCNDIKKLPVYTFCMCPGGMVVPAAAFDKTNIVNGMSFYQRDGKFANAACVASIHPEQLAGREVSSYDALKVVESYEQAFYEYAGGFKAPFCSIQDFIAKKIKKTSSETSYPLGLKPAPLWEMLPVEVTDSIRSGLLSFSRKLRGYEDGNLLGLESKTSSCIQVVRDSTGKCEGFENLYMAGEGSGYAGGIISSGADGVKIAMNIINGAKSYSENNQVLPSTGNLSMALTNTGHLNTK